MYKILVFLCLATLVLTACVPAAPAPPAEETPNMDDSDEQLPLTMLHIDGITEISSNDKAAYFLRSVPDKFCTAFLPEGWSASYWPYTYIMAFRTDFATATTRPLCVMQGCEHASPDCMAWFQVTGMHLQIYAGEDKLFWVHWIFEESYTSGTEPDIYYHERDYAYIDISNTDGADKKRLYTAAAHDIIDINMGFFYDGVHLTFTTAKMSANTPWGESSLITVHTDSGEVMGKYPLDSTTVLGIHDNEPLFLRTTPDPFRSQPDTGEYETLLFTIHPQSGEQTDRMRLNNDSSHWFEGRWNGAVFVGLDQSTRDFIEFDIDTAERRVIGSLPEEMDAESIQTWSLFNTRLLLFYNGPNHPYYFDTETGVLTEYTLLRRTFSGEFWSVLILGESDMEFFVVVGTQQYTIDSPIQYYEAVNSVGNRNVYAMISKENYWNGIPDYREVVIMA